MSLTYGELFAGYDGLGMGIRSVLGGTTSWFAEYDPAPSKILAHHYPDIPNLGDVTKIDWTQVEPVDVITGGSPCQDVSHAGKRAGMRPGTRSGLWASMADAIDIIRPRLVVWENVRGALSADADSALEYCAGCVGDPDDGPVLRALGRVLGDLADIGYDARWYGLRAADVGAAHGRFRIFLFATPADAFGGGWDGWAPVAVGRPFGGAAVAGRGKEARTLTLLPTPAVNDMGAAYTPDTWDQWTAKMQAAHGNGNGHGKSLNIEALRLMPTPVADHSRGLPSESTDYASLPNAVQPERWGDYDAAIARHADALGRPAPDPTEPGKNGPRLSPRFVEWLMMLPAGHVTDTPGLSRNDQLKALGNGVVPAQAAAACRAFLEDTAAIEAAS